MDADRATAVGLGLFAIVAIAGAHGRGGGTTAPAEPDAGALDVAVTVLEAPPARRGDAIVEASPRDRVVSVSVACAALERASLVVTDGSGVALAEPASLERVPPTAATVRGLVRARTLPPHPTETRAVVAVGSEACVQKAFTGVKRGDAVRSRMAAVNACGGRVGDVVLLTADVPSAGEDVARAEEATRSGEPARGLAMVERARGRLVGVEAAQADAVGAEAAIALGRNALARELAGRALGAGAPLSPVLRARLLRASVLAQAESEEASAAPAERASLTALETDDRARALGAALDLRVALVHDRFHDPPDVPAASRRLVELAANVDDETRGAIAAMLCRAGRALAESDHAKGEGVMREGAVAADQNGSLADRAFCAIAAGDYARDAGHLDDAESSYTRALDVLRDHPLPREQREAWFSAALLSERRHRYAEAFARAENAYGWVDLSLALEPDLAAREALLLDASPYYGSAARFAVLAEDARGAVEAAEWGKGRAFGALLRDQGEIASSDSVAFVVSRGEGAEARADRLDALARSLGPEDAALSYSILGRNDAGRFEALIGVVTRARTTARLVELPDDAGADMRALGAAVEGGDGERTRTLGARLYKVLLAPVEADLEGARRLFVSPHLSLHAMPWGALYDGARFAVERFSFARVPPLLLAAREPADDAPLFAPTSPRAWMVAVDPARPSEPALPGLRPLAVDVGARVHPSVILAGADLTPEGFLAGAAKVDAVFYGGHARYDGDRPLGSALLVTPSDGGVDRVEARAVLGLARRLDLVVLLGCETSRLWEGRSSYGDEAMGLQRAFLVGGARHVLGALWPVLDRDAEDFVHALLAQDGALDVVSAVGAAQRCIATAKCPGRGVSSWAGFVVDAR